MLIIGFIFTSEKSEYKRKEIIRIRPITSFQLYDSISIYLNQIPMYRRQWFALLKHSMEYPHLLFPF